MVACGPAPLNALVDVNTGPHVSRHQPIHVFAYIFHLSYTCPCYSRVSKIYS